MAGTPPPVQLAYASGGATGNAWSIVRAVLVITILLASVMLVRAGTELVYYVDAFPRTASWSHPILRRVLPLAAAAAALGGLLTIVFSLHLFRQGGQAGWLCFSLALLDFAAVSSMAAEVQAFVTATERDGWEGGFTLYLAGVLLTGPFAVLLVLVALTFFFTRPAVRAALQRT